MTKAEGSDLRLCIENLTQRKLELKAAQDAARQAENKLETFIWELEQNANAAPKGEF